MTVRRDRWAQYACAAPVFREDHVTWSGAYADGMLKEEEGRFGGLPAAEMPPVGPSALRWLERIDQLTGQRDELQRAYDELLARAESHRMSNIALVRSNDHLEAGLTEARRQLAEARAELLAHGAA